MSSVQMSSRRSGFMRLPRALKPANEDTLALYFSEGQDGNEPMCRYLLREGAKPKFSSLHMSALLQIPSVPEESELDSHIIHTTFDALTPAAEEVANLGRSESALKELVRSGGEVERVGRTGAVHLPFTVGYRKASTWMRRGIEG